MSTALKKQIFTYDDIHRLPDGCYEIIDGERRDMTPSGFEHGNIEGKFYALLARHFMNKGHVAVGDVGILINRNPLRLRAAAVVYISKEKAPERPKGILETAPDLIVEIISESNAAWEMTEKVKDYLAIGVERVLLVDPLTKTVSLYRKGKKEAMLYDFDEDVPALSDLTVKMNGLLA